MGRSAIEVTKSIWAPSVCMSDPPVRTCVSAFASVSQEEGQRNLQTDLQGSLRSTGGRIHMHLGVFSGGGRIQSIIRTMVTGPAVIGECRVSSVSLIYSHTCVHTCSVHTIYTIVHSILMNVYSHTLPVFSAPCCHYIMPAVITHFFLNNGSEVQRERTWSVDNMYVQYIHVINYIYSSIYIFHYFKLPLPIQFSLHYRCKYCRYIYLHVFF